MPHNPKRIPLATESSAYNTRGAFFSTIQLFQIITRAFGIMYCSFAVIALCFMYYFVALFLRSFSLPIILSRYLLLTLVQRTSGTR